MKEHLADFKRISGQKVAAKAKERSKNNKQLEEANRIILYNTDQLDKKSTKIEDLEIELADLIETRDHLFEQLELIMEAYDINME